MKTTNKNELLNSVLKHYLSAKETSNAAGPLLNMNLESELDACKKQDIILEIFKQALTNESWNILKRFEHDPGLEILQIYNFPVDSIGMAETPVTEDPEVSSYCLPAAILTGIARSIGQHPLSYSWENSGRLFRHVTSRLDSLNKFSSHGSQENLEWHTDNVSVDIAHAEKSTEDSCFTPQTLILYCQRADTNVPTQFVSVRGLCSRLSKKNLEVLKRPLFSFPSPDSVDTGFPIRENSPLLVEHNGVLLARHIDTAKANNLAGKLALEEWHSLLNDKTYWTSVLLLPGSVVLFKNNQVLHSRSGYQPHFNGSDRWFIRLYSAEEEFIHPAHPEVPFLSK